MKKILLLTLTLFIITLFSGCGSTGDKINLETYNKLENGMTQEDALTILGPNGDIVGESGIKGEQGYLIMYSYSGDAVSGSLGSSCNFQFQNGVLIAKGQMGLK